VEYRLTARLHHGTLGPWGTDRFVLMQLSGGDDNFTANLWGMGESSRMRINALGGDGSDAMTVVVQGRMRSNADLELNLRGEYGEDNIMVDAWSESPTIDSGARITANLSGLGVYDAFRPNEEAGNHVSFWYCGEMSGRLRFNLEGDRADDLVAFHAWLNPGSIGTIGDGTNTGARVFGGDSNDHVEFWLRGYRRAPSISGAIVDGGNGDHDIAFYSAFATVFPQQVNCEGRTFI